MAQSSSPPSRGQVRDAVLRTSLLAFVMKVFEQLHPGEPPLEPVWYLKAICWVLEKAGHLDGARQIIAVPPRHLKSIIASVAFPAWLLGRDPTIKVMVSTYSQELSRKHASDFRSVMSSEWYRRVFPGCAIRDDGDRMLEVVTTAGGGRRSVSVGGSITGFGADVIVIDDCLKADEARSQARRDELKAWYDGTLATRVNQIGSGAIVSIQQRLNEDDLPAHLLAKGFDLLNLPAIAEKPERIQIGPDQYHRREVGGLLDHPLLTRAGLEQQRRDLGPVQFAAQYQQTPVAPEGNLLRLEWFGRYEDVEERSWYHKVVQSWDTGMTAAPTSDYSVCTTWGFRERKWYLLDVLRERLDYPDLKRAVIREKRKWAADQIVIEDAGSGKSLFQEFHVQGPFKPILWPVTDSKDERLIGCLGEIEAGHLLLPEEAPWLDMFLSELRAFPNGRHDDQVDSMTQFILFQLRNWKWALSEYEPNGRLSRTVRLQQRPW